MDKFLPSIKQKYKDRLINREKQWPPCHSNNFLRLELVAREKGKGYSDNIQRGSLERRKQIHGVWFNYTHEGDKEKSVKRTPLSYGDLFKVESSKKPVRKVLVEGDAGIGKTTLSVSISEDWSCEKLFQEFELVLLLPLRHKKVASAGSLPELLKLLHPCTDVCKSVASYLEEDEAKKVLVIADGWDELSASERQEGSFLYDLLFETFPLMSVVVTSRPFASAPLHRLPCFDRFVEINGFGKDDIKEYIHCEFSSEHEKACRLLEQLEDNPLVKSVCSVPLNCAIVCHLWRFSEEVLPSTMTQLYTKIILNVILRNIRKKDSFKNVLSLPNFDALPKELQQSFRLLCEFAFEALKKNQIVFSQEELVEFFPEGFALDEKILCFGLLQSAETVLETGHGVSFHFLHLTFMEYLAALHLTEIAQLEVFISKFNHNFPYFALSIVWRFFFGLCHSKVEKRDKILRWAFEKVQNMGNNFLCQCAYEAQNEIITKNVIQCCYRNHFSFSFDISGDVHISGDVYGLPFLNSYNLFYYWLTYKSTLFEFSALLYVLDNMKECSELQIVIAYSDIGERYIRKLAEIFARKRGYLQVMYITICGINITGMCVSDIFCKALAAFPGAVQSDLVCACKYKIDGQYMGKHSIIYRNPVGLFDLPTIENKHNFFSNLKTLDLEVSLTSDVGTNDALLTTFTESLLTCCPHLSGLSLSHNNLGIPGASAVARYVHRSTVCGFNLQLDVTNLGDKGLMAFVSNLDCISSFGKLSVGGNSIHAAGVSYLTDAVCSGKIVCQGLDLSDNPLGLQGTLSIGRMLSSSHCQSFRLNLSGCNLTTTGNCLRNADSPYYYGTNISSELVIDVGQQLCLSPQNKTIIELNLKGSRFSGGCIHILVGLIHLCGSLEFLWCLDCGITSDDLIQLLDKVSQLKTSPLELCSRLSTWDLSDNKIDDKGALALIDHIPTCLTSISEIMLNGNPISRELKIRLKKVLRKHSQVRYSKKEFI